MQLFLEDFCRNFKQRKGKGECPVHRLGQDRSDHLFTCLQQLPTKKDLLYKGTPESSWAYPLNLFWCKKKRPMHTFL